MDRKSDDPLRESSDSDSDVEICVDDLPAGAQAPWYWENTSLDPEDDFDGRYGVDDDVTAQIQSLIDYIQNE